MQWIQLLHPDDGYTLHIMFVTVFNEVIIDFPTAENKSLYFLSLGRSMFFADDRFEFCPGLQFGYGEIQAGWRNNDFGDITTSGLRKFQVIWRRKR